MNNYEKVREKLCLISSFLAHIKSPTPATRESLPNLVRRAFFIILFSYSIQIALINELRKVGY